MYLLPTVAKFFFHYFTVILFEAGLSRMTKLSENFISASVIT